MELDLNIEFNHLLEVLDFVDKCNRGFNNGLTAKHQIFYDDSEHIVDSGSIIDEDSPITDL